MKKYLYIPTRLIILCALFGYCNKFYSQRDTLHIYYLGSQTNVLDSNDAKITKWAKSLKGKHSDVEIHAYYDNSDFKKYMAERAENIQLVVIRKARDFTTIKFAGPTKGKKWQRNMADIVYTVDRSSSQESKEKSEEIKSDSGSESKSNTATENSSKSTETSSKTVESTEKKEESNKTQESVKPMSVDKNNGYYMDSVYVNGVLKVTKRKIKKK